MPLVEAARTLDMTDQNVRNYIKRNPSLAVRTASRHGPPAFRLDRPRIERIARLRRELAELLNG